MTEIKITDEELVPEIAFRDETSSCWKLATEFASAVGHAPPLFSSCIRAINKADSILDVVDQESVRQVTVSSSEFLVKVSPTLKSVFYFAAKALHDGELRSIDHLTVKKLLSVFESREVASIIGLTFLYKRIQKKCDPKEWLVFQRKIHTQMEIGTILGEKMRHIGKGNGMLLGGIRLLAQATFALGAPEQFREFKKKVRKSSRIFDLKIEQEFFECNHLQVASLLVQDLGFCMPRSPVSMSLGMDALSVPSDQLPSRLKDHLLSWRAAMEYIEGYHSDGTPPKMIGFDYELKLPDEETEELREKIWMIIREGSQLDWIAKTKLELPTEIAEALELATVRVASSNPGRRNSYTEPLFDDSAFD
jgi:hypothetical protein